MSFVVYWGMLSEELLHFISHRLKMISITIIIVSAIGLVWFSYPGFSKVGVFQGSIGMPECVILFLFFGVLWLVLEIDSGARERKKRHEKHLAGFCKFAPEIDRFRKHLTSKSRYFNTLWRFGELREELLVFSAIIRRKFDIICPFIPRKFDKSEWERSKEEWRIFLDDLYICSKAGSLNEARQASMFPVGIFQNPPS